MANEIDIDEVAIKIVQALVSSADVHGNVKSYWLETRISEVVDVAYAFAYEIRQHKRYVDDRNGVNRV